jgi:hypothetical protein
LGVCPVAVAVDLVFVVGLEWAGDGPVLADLYLCVVYFDWEYGFVYCGDVCAVGVYGCVDELFVFL